MKVFCIGRNKTGTTSLKLALQELGYKMGSQPQGERLIKDWKNNNFSPIIELAKTADAFQDIPFSYNNTYKHRIHFLRILFLNSIFFNQYACFLKLFSRTWCIGILL